jgi:circadian clock protein KaiC
VTGSAESYLIRLKALAEEHSARCVIVDPVSTWTKSHDGTGVRGVAQRLIDWSKKQAITLLCSSLVDELADGYQSSTSLQLSTIADTWIQLDYLVQAGERNRGLAIIKSRGTWHSNQVRELILSDNGVTLADIYTAGGEVLMGTLRWEKESTERIAAEVAEVAAKLKRLRLDAEATVLEVRLKSLQTELVAKQTEKELLTRTTAAQERDLSLSDNRLRELRGADAKPPKAT